MLDFSFVKGLSKLVELQSIYGTTVYDLMVVRDTLKDEYCFNTNFKVDYLNKVLTVSVPINYSDIKIEWISEVYKYFIPFGICVETVKGEV